MPDSYCYLATHIIFSTKERFSFLIGQSKKDMHSYIAGIIKNFEGHPLIINGIDDHIHVLCLLPKDMSVSKFVQTIKSNSSKWFSAKYNNKFAWQRGYAAFAVSKSNVERVFEYIKSQEEHHKKISFVDEYKQYIEKHGFVYEDKEVSPPWGF